MVVGNVDFTRRSDFTNVLSFPADFGGDFKIWRYLSLPKYLKLLEDQFLYLAKLSDFDDAFEGSLPKTQPIAVDDLQQKYDMPDDAIEGYDYQLKQVRNHTYINCWHINSYESAAMWSIYSRTNESVAIQSSFSNLQNQVGAQAQLGAVAYIDYEEDFIPQGNMCYPSLCKRRSYSYENEFRILAYDMESQLGRKEVDDFKTVDVNLEELIERIFISPNAPSYFKELISNISEKYGHDFKVIKSSIDNDPFY